MANRWGNSVNSGWLHFLGLQNHCRWWLQPWNKRRLLLGRKVMTNLDSILKSRNITLQTKVCRVKGMVFPTVMYRCESWTIKKAEWEKNWCFRTVVLQKTLESPLYSKEIQPVHLQGDQSWVFIGRTDVEAETPILWPPDAKSWFIWKDPDAGKVWRWEERGTTENEMVGWHHWLKGHEFEQSLGDSEGQGSLACCCLWGGKESDRTELLNRTELLVLQLRKRQPTPVFLPGESRGQTRLSH